MRPILNLLLFNIIAFSLYSCNGFRGIAGPTYVKLYKNFSGYKEIQNAFNSFYQKHPENIISYSDWVTKGQVANDSIKDMVDQEKYARKRFHVAIHYNFPKSNTNYTDEWWTIKTPNNTYEFNVDIANCDENKLECDLVLSRVNGKSWDLKSRERKVALKVFQVEILPKLTNIIEENRLKKQ